MNARVFDDWRSLAHALLGALSALLPLARIIIVPAFIIYQLLEREPLPNKLGDLLEFLVGAGLVSLAKP